MKFPAPGNGPGNYVRHHSDSSIDARTVRVSYVPDNIPGSEEKRR